MTNAARIIADAITDSTAAYIEYLKERDKLQQTVDELTVALKTMALERSLRGVNNEFHPIQR